MTTSQAQLSVRIGGAHSAPGAGVPASTAAQLAPRFDWTYSRTTGFVEASASQFSGGPTAWRLTTREGAFIASGNWSFGTETFFDFGMLNNSPQGARLTLNAAAGRRIGFATIGAGLGVGLLRNLAGEYNAIRDERVLVSASLPGHADIGLKYQRTYPIVGLGGHRDIEATAAARLGVVTLAASAGRRKFPTSPGRAMYQAQARLQAMPWLAVEIAGGRSAATIEGYIAGDYVTGGLRIARPPASTRGPLIERTTTGARVTFVMRGREVAIAGEWNSWTPVPLANVGGQWVAQLELPPGAHKFMLIVDGENVVPAGVPRLPDGFGGEVGLLVL